jgi:hypothetical protein
VLHSQCKCFVLSHNTKGDLAGAERWELLDGVLVEPVDSVNR